MRRTINMEKISDVITIMITETNTINNYKIELIKDVNKISEYYKGIDANAIQNKYLETIKELEKLNKNINNYINYFKWLSDNYSENLLNASNNLNYIANDIINLKNNNNSIDYLDRSINV